MLTQQLRVPSLQLCSPSMVCWDWGHFFPKAMNTFNQRHQHLEIPYSTIAATRNDAAISRYPTLRTQLSIAHAEKRVFAVKFALNPS